MPICNRGSQPCSWGPKFTCVVLSLHMNQMTTPENKTHQVSLSFRQCHVSRVCQGSLNVAHNHPLLLISSLIYSVFILLLSYICMFFSNSFCIFFVLFCGILLTKMFLFHLSFRCRYNINPNMLFTKAVVCLPVALLGRLGYPCQKSFDLYVL